MGILERFRQRFEELRTLLERFWRPDFDLDVSETFYKILVFHIQVLGNLTGCYRPQFSQKPVRYADEAV